MNIFSIFVIYQVKSQQDTCKNDLWACAGFFDHLKNGRLLDSFDDDMKRLI